MEIVYENPWFQVRKNKGYHVIDQPHSANSVVIIPRLPNGNFLLVRTWRIAVKGRLTEFPRGCARPSETPEECASRELFEETGYEISPEKIQRLGTLYPDSGILTAQVNVAYADLSYAKVLPRQSEEEVLGIMEADDETMLQMIDANLITDGFTLSAFAKYLVKKQLGEIE